MKNKIHLFLITYLRRRNKMIEPYVKDFGSFQRHYSFMGWITNYGCAYGLHFHMEGERFYYSDSQGLIGLELIPTSDERIIPKRIRVLMREVSRNGKQVDLSNEDL